MLKVLGRKTVTKIQAINYLRLGDADLLPVDKNKPEDIRPEVKPMIDLITALESLDFSQAVDSLKDISELFIKDFQKAFVISPTQRLGISTTIFALAIFHMAVGAINERSVRTVSLTAALECAVRMSIKLDKKSPINTVSQHSKIFDAAFVNSKTPK